MTTNRVSPRLWNAWNSCLFWLSLPGWIIQEAFTQKDEDEEDGYGDEGWLQECKPEAVNKPGFLTRTKEGATELFFLLLATLAMAVMIVLAIVIGVPLLLFVAAMDLITGADVGWQGQIPTLGERLNPVNAIQSVTDDSELLP